MAVNANRKSKKRVGRMVDHESADHREFRNALGSFAAGVVIVTANSKGRFLGNTVSSFNSVSLLPPLMLFSIASSLLF
jgi:flavin reductase (DIM6/NTAB) family NADH-FMN oxidoreductase RutF